MTSSDVLLTVNGYTRRASWHFKAVDIAVTAGRGAMEANICADSGFKPEAYSCMSTDLKPESNKDIGPKAFLRWLVY